MGQIPKQDTKGELAIYDPKETQNVFEVLQEVWNENGEGAYYTCFVDEYYYEENPVNKGNVRLNEFVNADDRVFTLATSLQYSKDQQSILADAVYSVSQRSIACFYDLDNFEGNVYGVESVDETGGLYCSERFDQDLSLSENPDKDGRGNTLAQCGANGYGYVNWKKNGYLLQNDGSYKRKAGIPHCLMMGSILIRRGPAVTVTWTVVARWKRMRYDGTYVRGTRLSACG